MLILETRLPVLTRLGRALGDSTRCRIPPAMLAGPVHPGELARELGLSRSDVANHLTCRRGCGIVVGVPDGRRVRYELADAALSRALRDLLEVAFAVDTACSPTTHRAHDPRKRRPAGGEP